MINNIRNNTISELLAKENLDTLNKLKKAEIKNKRLISSEKELLNFFNNFLDTILIGDKNENENENENDNDNDNENEHENDNDSENKNENSENDKNDENTREIRRINNYLKTIDESKSFESQIEKKKDYLDDWWHKTYDDDDKELNLKILKLKIAYILNNLDKMLFEEVFGHTFATLANKLINRTNKKENQIIINDIKKK